MKIMIIDDDIISINILSEKLKSFGDINIAGTYTTGNEGLKMFPQIKPDILFLDIELPDMMGTDFIDKINLLYTFSTKIVIYSSYDKYMLQAFRKDAFDFLKKPIDIHELSNIICRYHKKELPSKETTFFTNNSNSFIDNNKRLLLYTGTNDFKILQTKEIGYFNYISSRKMWEAIIVGHQKIVLKRNTTADMILNIDQKFIQVHQSYIINIDYLIEVNENKCTLYPPFDDIDDIIIGRTYKKKLIERFCYL